MSARPLPRVLLALWLAGCATPTVDEGRPGRPGTTGPLGPGQAGGRAQAGGAASPGQVVAPGPGKPEDVAAAGAVGPLAPAAGIIGKLKAGPASLIANNAATLLGERGVGLVSDIGTGLVANHGGGVLSNNGGAYRLFALEEAPVAGAEVRLVDAAGQPLTAEVATTDAAGAFTLQRPEGLTDALVQAAFTAAGQPVVYMAALSATGPLEVDTATTLAAARWQLDRRAGRPTALPGPGLLARLRALLEPGKVPFMGRGSRDVADAFDQLMADDDGLQQAAASEATQLREPSRPWRVGPWHTTEALRAVGALPEDGTIRRGEASVFAVDGPGRLHLVVQGTRPRIIRVTADARLEVVAEVPPDATGPYAITFSPAKRLFLVHGTTADSLAITRVEADGTLTRLFETLPGSSNMPERAQGRLAASDAGEVYFTPATRHGILVARPGARTLEPFAGTYAQPGYQDGPRREALFNTPSAIAVSPDGRLYIADKNNHCIRRVEPDGTVVTVAGKPGETTPRFGRGAFARLGEPGSIVVAPDGTMFATDVGGRRAIVLRLSPDGSVFHVAGGPIPGKRDGLGPVARFIRPANLELDDAGNLYLEDLDSLDGQQYTYTLRKLVPPAP